MKLLLTTIAALVIIASKAEAAYASRGGYRRYDNRRDGYNHYDKRDGYHPQVESAEDRNYPITSYFTTVKNVVVATAYAYPGEQVDVCLQLNKGYVEAKVTGENIRSLSKALRQSGHTVAHVFAVRSEGEFKAGNYVLKVPKSAANLTAKEYRVGEKGQVVLEDTDQIRHVVLCEKFGNHAPEGYVKRRSTSGRPYGGEDARKERGYRRGGYPERYEPQREYGRRDDVPDFLNHSPRGGYARGGYARGGYARGGYALGTYNRGGYQDYRRGYEYTPVQSRRNTLYPVRNWHEGNGRGQMWDRTQSVSHDSQRSLSPYRRPRRSTYRRQRSRTVSLNASGELRRRGYLGPSYLDAYRAYRRNAGAYRGGYRGGYNGGYGNRYGSRERYGNRYGSRERYGSADRGYGSRGGYDRGYGRGYGFRREKGYGSRS